MYCDHKVMNNLFKSTLRIGNCMDFKISLSVKYKQ